MWELPRPRPGLADPPERSDTAESPITAMSVASVRGECPWRVSVASVRGEYPWRVSLVLC